MLDPDSGKMIAKNDLSTADFDVTVDVGPSFESKRNAVVRTLAGMLQMTSDPSDAKILQAVILMNMEGEGLSAVNEYYRKQLVEMGVEEPNEEEQAAMQEAAANPTPDPQADFLASEAEKNRATAEKMMADTAKALAEADKIVAQTENVDADTVKKEAETLEILNGAPPAPL
jgi:hypothetical protein